MSVFRMTLCRAGIVRHVLLVLFHVVHLAMRDCTFNFHGMVHLAGEVHGVVPMHFPSASIGGRQRVLIFTGLSEASGNGSYCSFGICIGVGVLRDGPSGRQTSKQRTQ